MDIFGPQSKLGLDAQLISFSQQFQSSAYIVNPNTVVCLWRFFSPMNVFQCFRGDAASIVYYDQVQDFFLHVNPHPDQTALRLWLQTVLYCVFHHGLQNEWGDQQLFRIALGTDPPVQLHSFPQIESAES